MSHGEQRSSVMSADLLVNYPAHARCVLAVDPGIATSGRAFATVGTSAKARRNTHCPFLSKLM